jgi:hypothetical protein
MFPVGIRITKRRTAYDFKHEALTISHKQTKALMVMHTLSCARLCAIKKADRNEEMWGDVNRPASTCYLIRPLDTPRLPNIDLDCGLRIYVSVKTNSVAMSSEHACLRWCLCMRRTERIGSTRCNCDRRQRNIMVDRQGTRGRVLDTTL